MQSLLDRIKKLAEENEVSLYEVEISSGVGNSTIGRWDKANPSINGVAKVAKYFHCSIDYLYNGGVKTDTISVHDAELLDNINKLKSSQKDLVIKLVNELL